MYKSSWQNIYHAILQIYGPDLQKCNKVEDPTEESTSIHEDFHLHQQLVWTLIQSIPIKRSVDVILKKNNHVAAVRSAQQFYPPVYNMLCTRHLRLFNSV